MSGVLRVWRNQHTQKNRGAKYHIIEVWDAMKSTAEMVRGVMIKSLL